MQDSVVTIETNLFGAVYVQVTYGINNAGDKITGMSCIKPKEMDDVIWEQHSLQIGSWVNGHIDQIRAARHHLEEYLCIN